MMADVARRLSRILFWIFLAVSIAGLISGWAVFMALSILILGVI